MTLVEAWLVLCEGQDGDRDAAAEVLLPALKRASSLAAKGHDMSSSAPEVEEARQRALLKLLEQRYRLENPTERVVWTYLRLCCATALVDELRNRAKTQPPAPREPDDGPGDRTSLVERQADDITTELRLERDYAEQAAAALDDVLLPEYERVRNEQRAGTGTRACAALSQLDRLSSGVSVADLVREEEGDALDPAAMTRKVNALYQRFSRARSELLQFLEKRGPCEQVPPEVFRFCALTARERFRRRAEGAP